MKVLKITLVLLTVLMCISCSNDSLKYIEDIEHIYFDPAQPEQLIISTSTLTNDNDYIIENSLTDGYKVTMVKTATTIEFEFKADEHIEHLQLLQYIRPTDEHTPFKLLGTGHFLLIKPIENFKVPATGYYKFTAIRYYRD